MVMSARSVPRFLPTLTEVVHMPALQPQTNSNEEAIDRRAVQEAFELRVRQQIDAVLDRRLNEAVAAAILEQVDVIAARLREEIEPLVRQAVDGVLANKTVSDG